MNASDACNKLSKWRSVLVGWMLGTRAIDSLGVKGYRDLIDRTLLLRAEVDALTQLGITKKLFTAQEFDAAVAESALHYDQLFEKKFLGYRTDASGVIIYNAELAHETNAKLGFPP